MKAVFPYGMSSPVKPLRQSRMNPSEIREYYVRVKTYSLIRTSTHVHYLKAPPGHKRLADRKTPSDHANYTHYRFARQK